MEPDLPSDCIWVMAADAAPFAHLFGCWEGRVGAEDVRLLVAPLGLGRAWALEVFTCALLVARAARAPALLAVRVDSLEVFHAAIAPTLRGFLAAGGGGTLALFNGLDLGDFLGGVVAFCGALTPAPPRLRVDVGHGIDVALDVKGGVRARRRVGAGRAERAPRLAAIAEAAAPNPARG